MRIIAVGGAGTIGKAVVEHLTARHDVVVAGRSSGDVQVDISSPDSVRLMYERVGAFDALVCTAGEAYFGPFGKATEEELALGVHSKLLGQIRLVLLGRSHVSDGGSFTLVSGYIFDDPIPEAVSFAVANGGVEGFVRAAALALDRGVRINAVSPGMAQDSSEQFGRFNPGAPPYPCPQSLPPSNEVWRDGVPEKSSGPGDHGHIRLPGGPHPRRWTRPRNGWTHWMLVTPRARFCAPGDHWRGCRVILARPAPAAPRPK